MTRILLLLISLVALVSDALADRQQLIQKVCVADGIEYSYEKPVPLASIITFSTTSEDIIGKWYLTATNIDDDDCVVFESPDSKSSDKISIETNTIDFSRLRLEKFYKADERYPEQNYCEHGYRLTINFISEYGEEDSVDIMLYVLPRIAPGKPVISGTHFISENYDWDTDCMMGCEPKTVFTFDVYAENATSFEVEIICGEGDKHYFDINEWIMDSNAVIASFTPWKQPVTNGQSSYLSSDYIEDQDWGEIIFIRGINEHGFGPYSDPIFTTDYITDPEILARIDKLHNQVGVSTPVADSLTLIGVGNSIVATADGDAVVTLEVIGVDGAKRAAVAGRGEAGVDLTTLPAGVYVVRATDGNDVKTMKLRK